MPLIKNGAEAEDVWKYTPDDEPLHGVGSYTVSLERYVMEASSFREGNHTIGVRLKPDDDPAALEPYLDGLALIEIDFPKYTDGRGYSQAQLLRRRYGYEGELRAVGHVLRDQIFYMNRSGFDAYETAHADLGSVLEALSEYSAVYQPGADDRKPVHALRHKS